mgnify:FL=1
MVQKFNTLLWPEVHWSLSALTCPLQPHLSLLSSAQPLIVNSRTRKFLVFGSMESWWQHVMSPSRIVHLCQNLFANIYISNLKSRSKTPVVITSFNGTWKTFFEGFPRIRKSQAANCLPGLSSDVSLIRHVSRLSRFLPDKLYNYLEFSCSPLAGLMTLTGHIVSRADRRASKGI